jgi:hypothetical protein
LPATVTDSEVFSLLGEYHMVGKKDWLPYEQAGYLYRRYKHHEIPPDALSVEVGLTKAKVTHLIAVYQFMVDHEDKSSDRWSYYDELLKGRTFKEALKLHPRFYEIITEKIKRQLVTHVFERTFTAGPGLALLRRTILKDWPPRYADRAHHAVETSVVAETEIDGANVPAMEMPMPVKKTRVRSLLKPMTR